MTTGRINQISIVDVCREINEFSHVLFSIERQYIANVL